MAGMLDSQYKDKLAQRRGNMEAKYIRERRAVRDRQTNQAGVGNHTGGKLTREKENKPGNYE